jgi:uncharacterized protein YqgV (UPF0045/DUF77 family)
MQINAAIQLLPLGDESDKYKTIDSAIELIQKSGLKYLVCPFETVVEAEASQIYELIEKIRLSSLESSSEIVINVKIHAANRDLRIDEKLEKY